MLDLLAEFGVESKTYEYEHATHPLNRRHRILKDYNRAENGEKLACRCDNRAFEWAEVCYGCKYEMLQQIVVI